MLTIVNRIGVGQSFESARKAFEKKHPDVIVRDVAMDYDSYNSKLTAGDDAADIFCVGSNQLAEYGRQGYLMPLSDAPSIMDELQKTEWIPFQDHFSAGGKLYGVPVYTDYRFLKNNTYLAQLTGFDMPKPPYSWRDLYEAAKNAGLGQPGQPVLMDDLSINPAVIDRYTMAKASREGRVNYDTQAFREDMEAYKRMVNENMIVLTDLYGYSSSPMMFHLTQEFSADTVLFPAVDGQDGVEVSCSGFGINPNSKNKALAVEFLAEYLKPEHQYKAKYGETNSMLLKDTALYDRTPYGGPGAEGNNSTWNREDLWKYAMDKWIFTDIDLLMGNIIAGTDVVKRYVEGGITLDELIGILQYKADALQNM